MELPCVAPVQQAQLYRVEVCYSATTTPEGPSNQYSRTLVPKAMNGIVFGTRVLKYWVLGPSGYWSSQVKQLVLGCPEPQGLRGIGSSVKNQARTSPHRLDSGWCISAKMQCKHLLIYLSIYKCIYTCLYIEIHLIGLYMHVYTYIYTHVRMYVRTYVRTYVCV